MLTHLTPIQILEIVDTLRFLEKEINESTASANNRKDFLFRVKQMKQQLGIE
jgi:hypothetical protein